MGTRLGPRHAREGWGRKGHLSDYHRPHPEDLDVRKFGLMEDLLAAVNAALRARKWSARQASLEAVGSDQFIRNLRRGRVPPVDKLRALCEVLGLEFYIGPPRDVGTVDEHRLQEAIETTDQTLREGGLELGSQEKAQVAAAVYELIGQERSPATTSRVKRLIAAMTGGTRSRR